MITSAPRVPVRRANLTQRASADLHAIERVSSIHQDMHQTIDQKMESLPDFPLASSLASSFEDHRLRKHADYQRVYRQGRKQFSSSMSYFFALREPESPIPAGPRVGLTVGKVLGKAVDRNRIKRRLRDIVRRRVALVHANADIILHPRRTVLTMEFARLESEVVRILTGIQSMIDKGGKPAPSPSPKPGQS